MKIKILLSALLFVLFSAGAANAQHFRHGVRHGGVVVVTPPHPVIEVRHDRGYRRGYYRGDRGYHRGYRRGYYRGDRGYHRGYYRHHRRY